jgi:hypothetical protein
MTTTARRLLAAATITSVISPASPRLLFGQQEWTPAKLIVDKSFTVSSDVALLDRPIAAFASRSGEIYAIDRTDPQVVVFGTTGRRIRVMGRKGTGPGEFERPCCIGGTGSLIWISDLQLKRVTFFNGATVDGVSALTSGENGAGFDPVAGVTGGRVVGVPTRMRSGAAVAEIDTMRVVLINPMTATQRVLFSTTHPSRTVAVQLGGGRRAFVTPPFDDRPRIAVDPAGRVAIIQQDAEIVREQKAFTIETRDSLGRSQLRMNIPVVPRDVQGKDVSAFVTSTAETLVRYFPSMAAAREAVRAALRLPSVHPVVRRAFFSIDGVLWISIADSGSRERWIFSRLPGGTPTTWRSVVLNADETLVATNSSHVWTWREREQGEGELLRYLLR